MAQLVAGRVVRALVRLGWESRPAKRQPRNLDEARAFTRHDTHSQGRTLKEGTARAIVKQVGVSEEELFSVY